MPHLAPYPLNTLPRGCGGAHRRAIRFFSKSLRFYPTDASTLNDRGLAYKAGGNMKEAWGKVDVALSIDLVLRLAGRNPVASRLTSRWASYRRRDLESQYARRSLAPGVIPTSPTNPRWNATISG